MGSFVFWGIICRNWGPKAKSPAKPPEIPGLRRSPPQVTADLDVVQREEFLKFLYNESTLRGATIVYTTHIFEGMDGWPTQMVFLNAETNNIEAVHYFKEGDNVLQVRPRAFALPGARDSLPRAGAGRPQSPPRECRSRQSKDPEPPPEWDGGGAGRG